MISFGSLPRDLKQMEAEWAAAHGAEELDVIPDFTALINQNSSAFAEEIAAMRPGITGAGGA